MSWSARPSFDFGTRTVLRITGFAIGLALALATIVALAPFSSALEAMSSCPATAPVVTLSGTYLDQVKSSTPLAGTTWDARGATFNAYPSATLYPFTVGSETAPVGLCVVGGIVRGQQSRTLTWDQMKSSYDGDGLRIASNNPYVVNGLRVDNVEDGVAPRDAKDRSPKRGDGFTLKNLYMTYIRDDCVENDDIAGGLIVDSLFDGCNTGISERPSSGNAQWNYPAPAGETITLDRVLLRLQALPGPRGSNDPTKLGHGQLFKWSSVANSVVIRDSIFYVETTPNGDSYFPFPAGTKTSNVTIVWGGSEAWKWSVPAGTTVTTNKAVWDSARTNWMQRHGCTSFGSCSGKLFAPDGDSSPSTSPTPSPAKSSSPSPTPSPTQPVASTPAPTSSPEPSTAPSPKPHGRGHRKK
jgi:hypothetical protein